VIFQWLSAAGSAKANGRACYWVAPEKSGSTCERRPIFPYVPKLSVLSVSRLTLQINAPALASAATLISRRMSAVTGCVGLR